MKKISFLNIGVILLTIAFTNSCGRVYFPIELKTLNRAERFKGQLEPNIELVSITESSITKANKAPYVRRILDGTDLNNPAKLIPLSKALKERLPENNDPGPYLIGVGDVFNYTDFRSQTDLNNTNERIAREIIVAGDGSVRLYPVGRVKAVGLTQAQLEDRIRELLIQKGKKSEFELSLVGFNSKKIYVSGNSVASFMLSYTNTPIFLRDIILEAKASENARVIIKRNGEDFETSVESVLKGAASRVRIFGGDMILIENLLFKQEKVLVVGETGGQTAILINSRERPTLSEALFSKSILDGVTSDFSQIYVIRKQKEDFMAYHLDITNPARASLSNEFEMRPDDIIFVATQPLSLYSRTLSQILGSTGLTLQARDTVRTEMGN